MARFGQQLEGRLVARVVDELGEAQAYARRFAWKVRTDMPRDSATWVLLAFSSPMDSMRRCPTLDATDAGIEGPLLELFASVCSSRKRPLPAECRWSEAWSNIKRVGSGSNGWPQNASEPNEGLGQRYDQEYAKARKLLERALPEFDSAEGDER